MVKFLVVLFLSNLIFATSYLPENDLHLPQTLKSKFKIRKKAFYKVTSLIENIYQEEAIEKFDRPLEIIGEWEDSRVNATAYMTEDSLKVIVYGGLARHPFMSIDSLALAICHEVGHHLGGAPKLKDYWGNTSWASTEGQSDYFAAAKCLKRTLPEITHLGADPLMNKKLDKDLDKRCDNLICRRTLMAGLRALWLHQSILLDNYHLSIIQKSEHISESTYDGYPSLQCRLDTFVQGALCDADSSIAFDEFDESIGSCEKKGKRPACWYKAKKAPTYFVSNP